MFFSSYTYTCKNKYISVTLSFVIVTEIVYNDVYSISCGWYWWELESLPSLTHDKHETRAKTISKRSPTEMKSDARLTSLS